jgi:hypothetical protein
VIQLPEGAKQGMTAAAMHAGAANEKTAEQNTAENENKYRMNVSFINHPGY